MAERNQNQNKDLRAYESMMEIKKILVPTDFSDESISAYTHAQELASRFGAKIDLIHVVPTLKYFSESISKLGVPLDVDEDLYPHVKDGAEHQLRGIMDDYFEEGNKGKAIVNIERKPSKAISDYAEKNGYDLIVMAARGAHSSDLLRGSITEKVSRYSTVPVFTVDNRLQPEGLKRILVPTDGSSISFACFPLALTIATIYDAEISLFHVQELYGSLSESLERHDDISEALDIYNSIIDNLEQYLSEHAVKSVKIKRGDEDFEDEVIITEDGTERSIPLHTILERGLSAHYVIESYAPEHSDLIVMTTHGHSGVARFFLGSTTEKIVQHVDMPVVTLKPSKELLS
ncbi:MAG: universal stress protein [Balneolaceae bacterium]|nr:universal stress protein [Balneolaceae bacterium]